MEIESLYSRVDSLEHFESFMAGQLGFDYCEYVGINYNNATRQFGYSFWGVRTEEGFYDRFEEASERWMTERDLEMFLENYRQLALKE